MLKKILSIAIGGVFGALIAIAGAQNRAPALEEIMTAATTMPYEPRTEAATEAVTEESTEPVTEDITFETETFTEVVELWTVYGWLPISGEDQRRIKQACDEVEIAYDLILAIMFVESSYRIECVGDSGNAVGGMQIWPKFWGWLAAEHGLDVNSPIEATLTGVYVFDYLLKKNGGDLNCALREYNTGDPEIYNGYEDRVFEAYEYIDSMPH